MQKFVQWSRVGIFCNERTRSTPLVPKLTFWCISYYFVHSGPFGCLMKLSAKWAELVQKFVPRSRVEIFRNERTWTTPLDPKLMFWCISYYYFGAFGIVWLPYETRCTTGLVQKFVPWSRVGIFCNERTRSTPLDPKLTFWCISYYLGAFRAAWLPYKTPCKMGRTSAKVSTRMSRSNFT